LPSWPTASYWEQIVKRQAGYPITAYAACSALGMSSAEVLEGLYAGRSGLTTAASEAPLPPLGIEAVLGALPEAPPSLPARFARYDTRLARIAHALFAEIEPALARALQRYGASRVALVLASSTAGLETTERAAMQLAATGRLPEAYSFDQAHAFHALTELVRAWSGARGPGYVVSTACSSGNKVFGSAARLLRAGLADAVLVGGIDSLCQITVRGFHSLGILSKEPCRPFGRDRDGTSIGEGGALLLVERAGDASAQLLGVGECCDAHHMTQPAPDGSGALAAMHAALAAAGLQAEQIDHVNAHGTGTPLNDAAEARAIATLFGRRVPVASTKGYTGHMLGAAAAMEAVFAIAAIERSVVPRSLGSDPADPALELRLSGEAERHACRYVLSNAFAFGGSNAAVVFGAAS
jgi:3-oxoacyl-[acyl-carrier-protein] synthase-1